MMGIIHEVVEWKNSHLGEKIIESLTQRVNRLATILTPMSNSTSRIE